MLRS
ncbi:hypothetical protein CGLO_18164 [Colletotrichum gloeosporioides Cg-14]|jgi:hypothetical protein